MRAEHLMLGDCKACRAATQAVHVAGACSRGQSMTVCSKQGGGQWEGSADFVAWAHLVASAASAARRGGDC
jgi:hypothetical protein